MSQIEYIIYCRKSSTDGDKQVQSIPDQIKRCMGYVENYNANHAEQIVIKQRPKNFDEFETAKDKAERQSADLYEQKIYESVQDLFVVTETQTAKTPHARKKRSAIMKMVKQGKIKGILSYSPDRQARNLLEGGELISYVDDPDVTLQLKYTNFHFENTASGKMMLGVRFVFAKQYSDAISENVNRGNKETMKRGKSLGQHKRGYDRIPEGEEGAGYYRPNEHRSSVKRAFQMKINEDRTDKEISNRLNSTGFKYKHGKQELHSTPNKLGKLWKDTFYYGIYEAGENSSDQRVDNIYYKEIISKEDFDYLQTKLVKKSGGQSRQERSKENMTLNILPQQFIHSSSGLLLSLEIPNKRRYKKQLKEAQKKDRSIQLADVIEPKNIGYRASKKEDGEENALVVKADEIIKAIERKLSCIKPTEKTYNSFIEYIKESRREGVNERKQILSACTKNINQLRKKLKNLISENGWMNYKGDHNEKEHYLQTKSTLEEQIEQAEETHRELKAQERKEPMELEVFIDIMFRSVEYYHNASYVQKREITKLFFSNIIVDKEKSLTIKVKPGLEELFSGKSIIGADDEIRTRDLDLGKVAL